MNVGIHLLFVPVHVFGKLYVYQTASDRYLNSHIFSRIIRKVQTGFKLIRVDFVLGGQRNWK